VKFPILLIFAACLGAINVGYDVNMRQIKDNTSLMNSLSLNQQLTQRISLNASASFTADRNNDLNRFLDARVGMADLSFTPFSGVVLGIRLNRSISSEEKNGRLIRDQLTNSTSGQIRYSPASWFNVNMGLGAHFVDYMNPSGDSTISGRDQGGITDVDISMNRTLFSGISSSISLAEHRTTGYQKDTGRDNLSIRLNYMFPALYRGGSLDAKITAGKLFTTYNDSNRTQRQDNWSSNLAMVVPVPLRNVSMEISTGWNYSDRYYESDDPDSAGQGDVLDRLQRQRNINASLRYDILENLNLNMTFSRDMLRVDQKQTATGVETLFDTYYTDDDRKFSASLSYTPGDSRITFFRSIQLLKRDTYGTWTDVWGIVHEDNYDYDQMREVLSLSSIIPLSDRVVLEAVIKGQSRETIYIMSEQSGTSKRSSTYSIEPTIRYDAGGDWTLMESIQLSADYTQFLFPEFASAGSDLLFRRISTKSYFQRVASDSTTFGISHLFRFQDQGTYEDAVFLRSEEVIGNTVTFNLGFHIGRDVGLTPSYSYEYQKRNYISQSIPSRVEHIHHVGLRTRMDLQHGNLSLDLTRSFYSRDERDSYWKASVGLNYQF